MTTRAELLAQRLAAVGRAFYAAGWMRGTAGNLSARLGRDDRYVITASGGQKGELEARNFVSLDIGLQRATPAYRRWSAETIVHDKLYASDATIGSILHIHGPFSTLVSRTVRPGECLRLDGFEYLKGLGFWDEGATVDVPVVENHAEIPTLARAVVEARREAPGVLVRSHGLYAWGEDVDAARRHVECFEFLAEMVWRERRP